MKVRLTQPPSQLAGPLTATPSLMKRQTPPRDRKGILIVDDQAGFAPLLQRFMPQYEIREVVDSKAAFAVAAEWRPSLFLIDLMLPDLHGFELAARLRAIPASAKVPIFFLSALVDSRADDGEPVRIQGYPAFGKPFNLSSLKKHIGLCLKMPGEWARITAGLKEGWIAGD